MKKTLKIALLIVVAVLALAATVFAACDPTEPQTPPPTPSENPVVVTATVDFGIDGVEDQTFTVNAGATFYTKLGSLIAPLVTNCSLEGYYIGNVKVTALTVAPDKDFTVTARWNANYTVEHYVEQDDGSFDKSKTETKSALLGSTVTAQPIEIEGYTFDPAVEGTVESVLLDDGKPTLKLYYKRSRVTLSFDKGLATSATGEMSSHTDFYGATYVLPSCGFLSATATFIGYNTKSDNTGTSYNAGDEVTLTENFTLYAIWQATVTEHVWVENDSADGQYTQSDDNAFSATVGSNAQSRNPNALKYELDGEHSGSVNNGIVEESGLTLTSYYVLRTFTVTYSDDGESEFVKWGQTHTVRTPANDDPNQEILSYCTSETGNGSDYKFGAQFTVTSDVTLYPMIADIYTDAGGSGDKLKLRRNFLGRGAAVLVVNGKEHEGFVTYSTVQDVVVGIDFDVTVYDAAGETVKVYHGRVTDAENHLFYYRDEALVGTYVLYDHLNDRFVGSMMLAFDGYSTGTLAVPDTEVDGRISYYWITHYEQTSLGDYHLYYVHPADMSVEYQDYVMLVKEPPQVQTEQQVDGYFMFFDDGGYANEGWQLVRNGEFKDQLLKLNGYGSGTLYDISYNESGKAELLKVYDGNYFYVEGVEEGEEEYEFVVKDKTEFYFILVPQQHNGEIYYLFLQRGEEQGVYLQSEASEYPQIYLDGYGVAQYFTDEDNFDNGSYTITEQNGEKIVIITFSSGGELAVNVTFAAEGGDYGSYIVFDDGFVIVDGVLTQYLGHASVIVIPEGVTEIADGVFKNVNLTSVTFPSTLQKIGDYAFENSSAAGAATLLKTVYFLGTTPPELGADVFRWVKGSNFKIYVPDGCEQAYRQAETWAADTPSVEGGYAQFVTSNAEQANKPEFEIRDGVLVSYNNKDVDPSNVAITIPDEVTEVAAGVFANLTYITSVNLNNVSVVGNRAFYGCNGLKTVVGNRVTAIGTEAFFECTSLTELTLPAIETVGDSAFARCFALTRVTLGGNASSIGAFAFSLCAVTPNADESSFDQHEFVLTLTGETAPDLGQTPFYGSMPRVYVGSYEIGVGFAEVGVWQQYLRYLRVKSNQQQTWYSVENFGDLLILGDRAELGEGSYSGLYKWEDNSTFVVTWFIGSLDGNYFTNSQRVIVNASGWLVGITLDGTTYSFVTEGTTLEYLNVRSSNLRLTLTAGSSDGVYNQQPIVVEIVNYRMQFTLNGSVHQLTLFNNNGALTFSETESKVVETKTYTAADGSTLTIQNGNYVFGGGNLKDIDGHEIDVSGCPWYLTKLNDNTYTATINWTDTTTNPWQSFKYTVTFHLDGDAFTYEWSKTASYKYLVAPDGTRIVALVEESGKVLSVHLIFATGSGSVEVVAKITTVHGNELTVTVSDNENSEFNGTYLLVLDLENNSFTYTRLS